MCRLCITELRMILIVLCILFSTAGLAAAAEPVPSSVCDIQHGSCSSGIVEFDIQPKPVLVMRELKFMVNVGNQAASVPNARVGLELTMPGMYMGQNAPMMKQVSGGRYEGTGVIMRCPTGKKIWRATISVNGQKTASFVFEVQ